MRNYIEGYVYEYLSSSNKTIISREVLEDGCREYLEQTPRLILNDYREDMVVGTLVDWEINELGFWARAETNLPKEYLYFCMLGYSWQLIELDYDPKRDHFIMEKLKLHGVSVTPRFHI